MQHTSDDDSDSDDKPDDETFVGRPETKVKKRRKKAFEDSNSDLDSDSESDEESDIEQEQQLIPRVRLAGVSERSTDVDAPNKERHHEGAAEARPSLLDAE